ncbi:hypothetical protein KAURM247S_06259 [Kitasatospora aureofaciens]|uniref:Bacterial bifunctional deaminase-reductase C-terminal domain-containing protein n=1 Tax=Kitasatospora aureofaciens TaxID=1894 RepID=A0A8H9LVE5_KITAU|nr:hypothetical protein GCM10010502_65270 [Kitasatospora aureofaciens]
MVRALLAAGLIDELHLYVHPIAIGKGLRLFDETADPIRLRLLKNTAFTTGVLYTVYGPADN